MKDARKNVYILYKNTCGLDIIPGLKNRNLTKKIKHFWDEAEIE